MRTDGSQKEYEHPNIIPSTEDFDYFAWMGMKWCWYEWYPKK